MTGATAWYPCFVGAVGLTSPTLSGLSLSYAWGSLGSPSQPETLGLHEVWVVGWVSTQQGPVSFLPKG